MKRGAERAIGSGDSVPPRGGAPEITIESDTADPLDALRAVRFDDVSREKSLRAFGVEYVHLQPRDGGDLYVTRHGWSCLGQILPHRWYADQWYARQGQRLAGCTGAVYRVRSRPVCGETADLVVKFSRMAREVPLLIAPSSADSTLPEALAAARFNSPFEEFGLVMELREGALDRRRIRAMTQRPLAIYVPPERLDLWRLGRSECRFRSHLERLSSDQENAAKAIELDIERMYVLLYGWIRGKDAEDALLHSAISEAEVCALTEQVSSELRDRGFCVLDNKPKHFILRENRRTGAPLRRKDGRLVYGLVDFELLQRTPEHQRLFETRRRRRYWLHRSPQAAPPAITLPSSLTATTIFGVRYLFSTTPDGGRLWVVGGDPEVFDYFLPDRWRRTPRLQLSATHEVYRTRTQDGVHLVYRRSRVGATPRSDPLEPNGQEIRRQGFNSPFEEVAIAQLLQQLGIQTTRPRAIYRTAHVSSEVAYLRDQRRFVEHADLVTPETVPEPILSSDHDYYVLWDRCLGPMPTGGPSERADSGTCEGPDGSAHTFVDLETAREDGLLNRETYERFLLDARARLRRVGSLGDHLRDLDIACRIGMNGPRNETPDPLDLRVCMDALTAYELDLLPEPDYRRLVARLDSRLRSVDCEKLDLRGTDLLLYMDPDGTWDLDASGDPITTLCSFELIRGLYRPLRWSP